MSTTSDLLMRLTVSGLVFTLLALIVVVVVARLLRRAARRRATGRPANQCVCGYPLGELSVPRCPECGRVVGFDATPEQLGLTTEQLEQVRRVRDGRAAKAG